MGVTGRLLILSLYYPPDLSACSFRTAALVRALSTLAPDLEVDVLTSRPHRYQSFASDAPDRESHGRVTIHRLPLPAHAADMRSQALSYAQFARQAAAAARRLDPDLVFATSSRLMTATVGAWIARRARRPLYLDIRDLFADTMADILPRGAAGSVGLVAGWIERWTLRRAAHVNLVSEGFAPYIRARYPALPLTFFTNGIDDEFVDVRVPVSAPGDGVATVVYAGNMGEGQGLHGIVPGLAAALRGQVRFRLIGDGGRRAQLADALRVSGADAVELLPPMPRSQLLAEYMRADALFLHLNAHEAFTRVLPSKIFEYAALGKPIWAGVGGYAAGFLRTEVTNAAVFAPLDVAAGVEAWRSLTLTHTPRPTFVARFARTAIMRALAANLLEYLPGGRQ